MESIDQLKQRNELLLQAVGEGIYGLDANGNTTFVNPIAAKMLGWNAEELIGQPMHSLHHHSHPDGSHYPTHECPIYAAFKDGAIHEVNDEVFWRKDGSSFPVEYTSTPIFESKKLVGAVIVFRDITQRKQAEAELAKAYAEVECLKERLQAENVYLQQEIQTQHNFQEITGGSNALKKVLHQVEQVAETDATVLILGETGTGKELFARAVHNLSPRNDRPLVKVNCAALPANLIESELFGHEKGSFTGALTRKIGRFELADQGTIFLDEIGDLPIELQAKLLRVLQEGEFERVGSHKTLSVNVRIIAATNRDLFKEVSEGDFREDLYYRLNVFPLELPPLRKRKKDIPLLVKLFVGKYCKKLGKKIDNIPSSVLDDMKVYPWPGNVRELENIVERAVILTRGESLQIDKSLLTENVMQKTSGSYLTLQDLERQHITDVLKQTNWTISGSEGAAKILDINPNTLRSRIQKLDIKRSTSSS